MKYCEGWTPAKCDGKPSGTTKCSLNKTSFDRCEDGKWKNYPCASNWVCPSGGTKCEEKPSITPTNNPTKTPTATATPSCVSAGGKRNISTGKCCPSLVETNCTGSGSYLECLCSSITPTPATKTCVVGACAGTSCLLTTKTVDYNTTCQSSSCASNSDCKVTPTAIPSGCECVDNTYVGLGCGHSTGYPCSNAPKTCDNASCASTCSQETPGYTGHCLNDTDCVCSAVSPTSAGADSCGGDWTCTTKASSVCLSSGGDVGTCTNSQGARGTCCIPPASTREELLCYRGLGTWTNGVCTYPVPTPTPTPAGMIEIPAAGSLDNYNSPGDSDKFAQLTDQLTGVIYSCQKSGSKSGAALRACFCRSVNCSSASGKLIADKLSTASNDANGLQCVEFVNIMETVLRSGTTNNCGSNGAQEASDMVTCDEPGYTKYYPSNKNTTFHNGDIIVWSHGGIGGQEGHVAVCIKVSADGKSCTIAESNANGDQQVGYRTISLTSTTDEDAPDVILRR